jgi:hypothetical protein
VEPRAQEPSIWARIKSAFSFSPKVEPLPSQTVQAVNTVQNTPASVLGDKLSNDFRVQYLFVGFKGADKISKGGSFTHNEAQTVNTLKHFRVDTGASSGMSEEIEGLIRGYARKYGVNEEHALKVARMESGGNPNAISSTGAIGIYQFTGKTASEWGIRNRFNAAENIEAGIKFMASSGTKLTQRGLTTDPTSQYLVHQLGVAGATELLKAASDDKRIDQLSKPLQRAIRLNAGGRGVKTAKDYVQVTQAQLEAKSVAVAPVKAAPAPPLQTSSFSPAIVMPKGTKLDDANAEPQVAQVDLDRVMQQDSETEPSKRPSVRGTPIPATATAQSKPAVTDVVRTRNGLSIAVG